MISIADIETAREALKGHVVNTPCLHSRTLSAITGAEVWLDQAELRMLQVYYFDRKESHLKTLTFSDYALYDDAFWKPGRMFMQNHQTGKSTELLWGNYQFKLGLQDVRDFSTNSLKRVN